MRALLHLLRAARPSLRGSLSARLVWAISLSALSGATAGVLPALVGVAINALVGRPSQKSPGLGGWLAGILEGAGVGRVMLAALIGTLATVGVSVLSSHRGTAFAAELTSALRIEMLRSVLRASPREVDAFGQKMAQKKGAPPAPPGVKVPEVKGAEVVKLAVARDAATLADFSGSVLTGLPQAALTLVIVAWELVSVKMWLVLVGSLVLFVLSRLLADRASKLVSRRMASMQSTDVAIFGALGETLAGAEELRLLGARDQVLGELSEAARKAADARLRFASALALSGQIKSAFTALSPLLVLGALVATGLASEAGVGGAGPQSASGAPSSTGDVAKLLLFVPLLMARFEALDALRAGLIERAPMLRAAEGMLSLPVFPPDAATPAKASDVRGGEIAISDLTYTPPGANKAVLSDLSLKIPEGAIVGICGPSGCGKTTLARMLLRLDMPDRGKIDVGGVDIARLPADEVAHVFGVLGQSSRLFERTIGDNLKMGISKTPEDSLLQKLLGLVKLDVLLGQGEGRGLSTKFKAVPPSLSGGEQRRVMLARMLAREAKIFVLDEPEAGLPSATAEEILKSVADLADGRTCVVITHAPHLLKSTFNVLLDGGKIAATGTHEELSANNEAYRALLAEGLKKK